MTPKQIENLLETCEGDTDLVDGFDELPAEFQEKVKFALENGHVPDEDWKGVSTQMEAEIDWRMHMLIATGPRIESTRSERC